MNELTKTNGRPPATQTESLLNQLPVWLRYLIGAYPTAKVNSATYFVYEDQFGDVDDERMLQAVRRAVKSHRFASFPTVQELRAALDALAWQQVATRHAVDLSATRHTLLERGYRGDVPTAEWRELRKLMIANGRAIGAAALGRKYRALTEQELA